MSDRIGTAPPIVDSAARIAPGEGVVVHQKPLTAVATGSGDLADLAEALTSAVAALVDAGDLSFGPVAAGLQSFVVAHQPTGVAAVLDTSPDPIAFLFDQAAAIGTSTHQASGRAGWTTVFIEGETVGLVVGPELDRPATAWSRLVAGTVPGAGVVLPLARSAAPADTSRSGAATVGREQTPATGAAAGGRSVLDLTEQPSQSRSDQAWSWPPAGAQALERAERAMTPGDQRQQAPEADRAPVGQAGEAAADQAGEATDQTSKRSHRGGIGALLTQQRQRESGPGPAAGGTTAGQAPGAPPAREPISGPPPMPGSPPPGAGSPTDTGASPSAKPESNSSLDKEPGRATDSGTGTEPIPSPGSSSNSTTDDRSDSSIGSDREPKPGPGLDSSLGADREPKPSPSPSPSPGLGPSAGLGSGSAPDGRPGPIAGTPPLPDGPPATPQATSRSSGSARQPISGIPPMPGGRSTDGDESDPLGRLPRPSPNAKPIAGPPPMPESGPATDSPPMPGGGPKTDSAPATDSGPATDGAPATDSPPATDSAPATTGDRETSAERTESS